MSKTCHKTTTIKAEQFDGSQKYIFGHKVMSEDSLVDALTHDPVYYSILINEGDPEEESDEVVFEIGDWIIKDGEDINVIADDVFKNKYAELPVIPKCVADWIEECKQKHTPFSDMLCSERRPEQMRDWMALTPGTYQFDYARYQKYQELVAHAWLDGYQLEAQHD
ncbi:DUF1642 domain-containing protein [Levilactobacillus brevis]|uniref:DUF1642 domain-containing protein n=1 Tax=Levilactobacillus brevis TaxID=1580 RepID=UPI001CFA945A|nr:DUF1642 domain-containing protein [Levilactobacillus brevis]MCB4357952.1 DUF1642 domain-containing protein [Levilactobacillus brevis]